MSASANPKAPLTMRVPVTTMEEMPVLSEAERGDLITSLKNAEAEITAGNCTMHDPGTFVEHMMSVRAQAQAQAQALPKKAV